MMYFVEKVTVTPRFLSREVKTQKRERTPPYGEFSLFSFKRIVVIYNAIILLRLPTCTRKLHRMDSRIRRLLFQRLIVL